MSKAFRVCAMTFFILTATAVLLFGQTDQGGVRGTVSDPTGAVVPGATITATNIATGVTTRTVSTSAGLYSIPTLRAGVYRVQAEHVGFKRAVRDNVTVNAAVILGLDLTLEVGQMTQIVEVQASAALVEKETTTLDTSVNPRTYLDLPLNVGGSRSAEAFISLAPGVYGNGSFNYNANGGQLFSREVRIDGLDVSNILSQPGDTSKVMTLPPEALQEFTYQTSTPSADQGNNMSGTIQYTIRSGTNQLHGSVYEFYTGNALAARNFFQSNLSRNAQNEYGGTIGGPIYIPHLYNGKNRSFFFFNSNNFDTRSSPNNQFMTVPTAQEHFGDFSDYKNAQGQLIPIYDPATTAPAPGGGSTRTPFPGNIIPADRISLVSANIATGIPNPPPGSGLAANFLTRNLNTNGFHNQTIKIDHILTDRQRFSFTFNRNNSSQLQCGNPCFDPTNTKALTVAAGVNSSQLFTAKHRFYHLNYDLTISPMTLFHTTLGVDWYAQINNWDSYAKNWGPFLGLSNVGNGPFPGIQFGSGSFGSLRAQYVGLGVQGNGNNDLYAGWIPQGVWSFTLIRGRNSFKLGGEHQWFENEITQPNNTAEYIFTPNETALPTALSTTGNPFASFLLGEVDSGSRHVQNEATTAVYWYHGLYVQDDIKVSRNLAVNAGLRYELFAPFYDKHDVLSIMSPTTPNPGCGGCPGALIFAGNGPGRTGTRRLSPPIVKNNFTPRLGIAYSLKPTVVIRAGYAILDEMPAAAGSGGVRWSDLGFVADQVFQSSNNGVTPAFNWNNPFPAFRQPPFIDPSFGIGSVVDIYDSNASHPAYLQEWHFNVQDSFRPNWLLDVGYVGSKGTRLYSGTNNVNQTNSKYLSLGPLLTDSITDPAVVAAGFKPPYAGFQGSLAQALRPFPQYLYVGAGINELDLLLLGGAQNGSSTYHALQAKLQHNFTQGLFLLASYTWSKWLTNAPTTAGAGTGSISTQGGFEGVSARDQYNRKLEHALGPTPPQAFTLGFNYELPVGPGKRFAGSATGLASKVLKGWQLNGILSYYAGTPLTVFVNNTLPIFNDINFPNIVSGVPQKLNTHITTPKGPGAQLYLNPAAFAQPAPFTYGNGPQTLDVRGFGAPNENIGLMKRTYFAGEKANLEIRFEVFNVFNRHAFGGIDSNLNDPNFGQVTSVSAGRTAQIGGKIVF